MKASAFNSGVKLAPEPHQSLLQLLLEVVALLLDGLPLTLGDVVTCSSFTFDTNGLKATA